MTSTITTPHYDPDSIALADFRLDPAPPETVARRGLDELERATAKAWPLVASERQIYRFGLFYGREVEKGPGGALVGSHPVGPIPAWLVAIAGVEMVPRGGVGRGGAAPPPTRNGFRFFVLADSDLGPVSGVLISGDSMVGLVWG